MTNPFPQGSNAWHLAEQIVSRSVADNWDAAIREWELFNVWTVRYPERCLCTHSPIVEICQLRNRRNGQLANVGNCCVKKFTRLESDLIFQAVGRVRWDHSHALNMATIQFAYGRKWITPWEYEFYMNTWRKRVLSPKREYWREKINEKILQKITKEQL